MNGPDDPDSLLEQRRRYVSAFNHTMLSIWKERIALLKAVDTGALYNSIAEIGMNADAQFTSIALAQSFNLYGLFVDYGTGSNTFRGNPGDIGRDNPRRRKPWFSKKYFASVMNLREFFADNLGQTAANVVSNALTARVARHFLT